MLPLTSDLSEVDGGPSPFNGEYSMWKIIQQGAQKDLDKTALITAFQPAGHLEGLVGPSTPSFPAAATVLNWSYRQMTLATVRLGSILDRHNTPSDAAITCFAWNRAEVYLMTWLGYYRCLAWRPLDLSLLKPENEEDLKYYLSATNKSTIFVVENAEAAERLDAVRRSIGAATTSLIGFSCSSVPENNSSWMSLPALAKQSFTEQQDTPNPSPDHRDRVSSIGFTSGTSSGVPKGIEYTVGDWLHAMTTDFCRVTGPNARRIATVPNARTGFVWAGITVFSQGATLVIPSPRFEPQSLFDGIERFQATHMGLVPQLIPMLLGHPSFAREKLKSLKLVQSVGDVLTSAIYRTFTQALPDVYFVNSYAMTESAGFVAWGDEPAPQPLPLYRNIVGVGKVQHGSRLRVVDEKTGEVVKRGEAGELHITGFSTISHYVNNVHQESFYQYGGDVWLKTGDVAIIDKEGFVYVGGRYKDVIRTELDAIVPIGIEACLSRHNGAQSVVVGVPSGKYVELPWVIVKEIPAGQTVQDMEDIVNQSLDTEYHLAGVSTLGEIGLEDWPRDSWGKLVKRELKAHLLKHLSLS